MKIFTRFKLFPWRPVTGLVFAGLLGWMAAWFILPSSGTPAASFSVRADPVQDTRLGVPSIQSLPGSSALGRNEISQTSQALEQLLQRQEKISEGAARSAPPLLPSSQGNPMSVPMSVLGKPATPGEHDTDLAKKMKVMRELQINAMSDIQSVPPGDTKKLMAAMERFDAQMRAAGAPSIIDMDNLRKTFEGAERLQQLNRQLIAEAEKGRNADANQIKAMTQEIQAVQQAMSRKVIKEDVLKKLITQ